MYTAGIVIYSGADEIEISGSFEVLTSIRTIDTGRWTNDAAYSVLLLSDTLEPVKTSHGLCIQPTARLGDVGKLDVIVIPGGPGARLQKYPDSLLPWLKSAGPYAQYILCLTTGAYIMARAGMLKQRRVATYPGFAADIKRIEPTCKVIGEERVVLDDCKLFSSSGISNAIETTLALVERMEGFRSAEIAAKRISWPIIVDEFVPVYST